jgi:hypothetical protein
MTTSPVRLLNPLDGSGPHFGRSTTGRASDRHTVAVHLTRPRSRLPLLALLALSAVLLVWVPTPPAAGQESSGPGRALAASDFATEAWGDPWDFSNSEDLLLDRGPTWALQDPRIEDGAARFALSEPGYVSPLWGGYPGGLYLGREGGAMQNRLDADRYTHLSLHAYSSQAVPAGVFWWGCEGLDPACMGGQSFLLRQGWNTYNITLRNNGFGLPKEWSGQMTGLRLAMSPSSRTEVALDWIRAYEPSTTMQAARSATWDLDADSANNTPEKPNWGHVRCLASVAETCDLSFLPAGRYTVGGSVAVELVRRSRPVLLDPDEVGGRDYSAATPWTFAAPDDVSGWGNTEPPTFGSRLESRNAPPVWNDPYMWLSLRQGPVDTRRFHRFTVRSGYEGPFRLEDDEGGGSMARIIWQHAGYPGVQQTEDIVTYGGTRTVTVDLAAPGVHETDNLAEWDFDWDVWPVVALRWDPNEDRGPRRWWLERVALRADDEAGTRFRVRWYDTGFAPGSTVQLFRDTDGTGFDGVPISPRLAQRPGTSAFDWSVGGTPPGRYWVYAVTEGPGGTGRAYSTGPVRVVGASLAGTVDGQSPSPAVPLPRTLADACPRPGVPDAGFTDVAQGSTHAAAVDCLAWWRVTQPAGGYAPQDQVTRGQMASFLVRVVAATGQALPPGRDAFPDDTGSPHAAAIDALAAAGVVAGFPDGTFRPQEPVNRAQMASFLVRAAERRTGRLAASADFFTDDDGLVHEPAIDKAAGAGIAGGTAEGRYSPYPTVRRDQMASFVVRLLDLLVASGSGRPPGR